MWGATIAHIRFAIKLQNFNPRSPCGERLMIIACETISICISIHAPRVGSDDVAAIHSNPSIDFNPRSPCGERPRIAQCLVMELLFQSTLPVWGATTILFTYRSFHCDFNPRSPCGERLQQKIVREHTVVISIHAPRVGSDCYKL